MTEKAAELRSQLLYMQSQQQQQQEEPAGSGSRSPSRSPERKPSYKHKLSVRINEAATQPSVFAGAAAQPGFRLSASSVGGLGPDNDGGGGSGSGPGRPRVASSGGAGIPSPPSRAISRVNSSWSDAGDSLLGLNAGATPTHGAGSRSSSVFRIQQRSISEDQQSHSRIRMLEAEVLQWKARVQESSEESDRRQQSYLRREEAGGLRVAELEAQLRDSIGARAETDTGAVVGKAQAGLRDLHTHVVCEIESLLELQAVSLKSREHASVREFKAKLAETQAQVALEQGANNRSEGAWLARTEMETVQGIALQLDSKYKLAVQECARFKAQFQCQEDDRQLYVKQLVAVKRENGALRAEVRHLTLDLRRLEGEREELRLPARHADAGRATHADAGGGASVGGGAGGGAGEAPTGGLGPGPAAERPVGGGRPCSASAASPGLQTRTQHGLLQRTLAHHDSSRSSPRTPQPHRQASVSGCGLLVCASAVPPWLRWRGDTTGPASAASPPGVGREVHAKLHRYEAEVAGLKQLVEQERRRTEQARASHTAQLRQRTELQSLLRQCMDDVRGRRRGLEANIERPPLPNPAQQRTHPPLTPHRVTLRLRPRNVDDDDDDDDVIIPSAAQCHPAQRLRAPSSLLPPRLLLLLPTIARQQQQQQLGRRRPASAHPSTTSFSGSTGWPGSRVPGALPGGPAAGVRWRPAVVDGQLVATLTPTRGHKGGAGAVSPDMLMDEEDRDTMLQELLAKEEVLQLLFARSFPAMTPCEGSDAGALGAAQGEKEPQVVATARAMGAKARPACQALTDGSSVGAPVRPGSALRGSHQASAAAVRGGGSSAHATQQHAGMFVGGGGCVGGGGHPRMTQALAGDGVGAVEGQRPAIDVNIHDIYIYIVES
ncbi:MAG: hypothetical protein WDW36_009151 [Sanguina aurantia]